MKTIGDKLGNFNIVGVKPGALNYDESSFENLNQDSFPGKWKIIVFYPNFLLIITSLLFIVAIYEGKKIGQKWRFSILPIFFTIFCCF